MAAGPLTSRVLWEKCQVYGTVVDVFIPNKLSKAGKRFAFVRFIKTPKSSVPKSTDFPPVDNPLISPSPALVLDEGALMSVDFSNERWEELRIFIPCKSKEVPQDFVSDERVVWVDIEGIPLYAWKRETFKKIGKKWGETVDIEDSSDSTFGRKRLCIITKHPTSILETFKIIVKGRVFMVRAKELFMWNPLFLDVKEKVYTSENDSVHEEKNKDSQFHSSEDEEEEGEFISSEVEEVAETIFGEASAASPKLFPTEQVSDDPFGINLLLNQKKTEVENKDPSESLSHPPGFTPLVPEEVNIRNQPYREDGDFMSFGSSSKISVKVMNNSHVDQKEDSYHSVGPSMVNKGGSVLGVLEDVIKVGQAMGYTMEGCEKDFVSIIGNQGADVGFS
ncbi:hypothetical protein Tco_0356854 [Tanacetum coccineum]